MNCLHDPSADPAACHTCGPFDVADDDRCEIDIFSVERARRAGKLFAKTCRALGENVQLTLGYDAVAAGLGFAGWERLVRQGVPEFPLWSDARCRAGVVAMLRDIDVNVLEGAVDRIHEVFGMRECG